MMPLPPCLVLPMKGWAAIEFVSLISCARVIATTRKSNPQLYVHQQVPALIQMVTLLDELLVGMQRSCGQ